MPALHYDPKEVGKRIQQLRKERNLSQEQLAEKLNVSLNTIAKIECGLRTPSIDLSIDIMEFFDTSIQYLFTGESLESVERRERIRQIDEVIEQIDKAQKLLQEKREELLQIKKDLE